jgi:hypothetical protein
VQRELPAFAYARCRCGHEFWHHNRPPMGCQPRADMQQHGPVTGLCECLVFGNDRTPNEREQRR